MNETTANKALLDAAKRLTPEFRSTALLSGWPYDIVSQITIEERDGDLFVQYPDEIASRVEDLEYGTQKSAPNAVIRVFMDSHAGPTNDIFDSAFENVISSLGAFN